VASVRLETDLTIRGTRQGKTRQAPKIKSITLMRVLNPPKVENHPPNHSPRFQPFQVWTGTWAIFLIWCDFFYDLSFVINL
jgi:hypothetical protein